MALAPLVKLSKMQNFNINIFKINVWHPAYLAPISTLFGQCHSMEILFMASQDSFRSSPRDFESFFLPQVYPFWVIMHTLLSFEV